MDLSQSICYELASTVRHNSSPNHHYNSGCHQFSSNNKEAFHGYFRSHHGGCWSSGHPSCGFNSNRRPICQVCAKLDTLPSSVIIILTWAIKVHHLTPMVVPLPLSLLVVMVQVRHSLLFLLWCLIQLVIWTLSKQQHLLNLLTHIFGVLHLSYP